MKQICFAIKCPHAAEVHKGSIRGRGGACGVTEQEEGKKNGAKYCRLLRAKKQNKKTKNEVFTPFEHTHGAVLIPRLIKKKHKTVITTDVTPIIKCLVMIRKKAD